MNVSLCVHLSLFNLLGHCTRVLNRVLVICAVNTNISKITCLLT